MVLILQSIIWIVGITYAIYIAVFEMFIGGWADIITTSISMMKDSVTNDLMKDLFWGIAKIIFASITGWFIIAVTSLLATMVGDYLE